MRVEVSKDQQMKEKPRMKRIAPVVGTAVLGLSTLTACGGGATAAPSPYATVVRRLR
jgi:hypothetical protein